MVIEAAVITAVVAAIQPYLVKLGQGLGDKAVEAGVEAGAKLFAWVKEKFAGKAAESEAAKDALKALDRLEKAPEDADKAGALRVALTEALEAQPELATELAAMVKDDPVVRDAMTLNVSGAGAKAIQNKGDNNLNHIG